MKQQFLADIVDTFRTYIYEHNRKVVPTSATLTVYKPGSTTKLIDAAAMTVAGDGLLSYALTAVHNDVAGENYKCVIAYVISGTTYYTTIFYDVVNSKLAAVITDDDLIAELPQIKDRNYRVHGTASGGSTTTIVSMELSYYVDDYFTGGLATNLTNEQTREITDFVSSTGTVTTATFATANAAGNKYMLQRSFTREINRAFEKIEEELTKKGKRAYLVLDPNDLRGTHILFAVAEVCKGMTTEGEGSYWWEMWKDYEKKAMESFSSLNFKYDSSGDGIFGTTEEGRRNRMSVRYPSLR